MIGDRQVFSTCRTIQTNEGIWISNPTAEQITEAGWLPYVPPVIPPQPQTEPDTETMMDAVKKMFATQAETLTDEEALEVAAIFSTWASKVKEAEASGKGVEAGERLWYNGKLYKVVQPHIPQADWTPDKTPALYTEVSVVEWPEWVQPIGASDAYMKGAHVAHNDKHWESEVDNNVWEPGTYGWVEV